MTVKLNGSASAEERHISALEYLIGQPLDSMFKAFIVQHDGAKPDANSFSVNGIAHMGGVDEFIEVKDIPSVRESLEDIGPRVYPIAHSEGGNYILIDQDEGGSILFWDHEVQGGIYRIANNFDEFLQILEPFDPGDIKPAEGQVTSAWIDPDFFKQFNE